MVNKRPGLPRQDLSPLLASRTHPIPTKSSKNPKFSTNQALKPPDPIKNPKKTHVSFTDRSCLACFPSDLGDLGALSELIGSEKIPRASSINRNMENVRRPVKMRVYGDDLRL